MKQVAVLLMSYGTPHDTDEIWDYYTHIRRGHAPTQELYDDLVRRYDEIGGVSPLAAISEAQRQALEERLNADDPTTAYRVYSGLRHIAPFIEDAVQQIVADGYPTIHGLVLAPFNSGFQEQYHQRAQDALSSHPEVTYVPHLHFGNQPDFITYWAQALQAVHQPSRKQKVLFTAHSLPERLLLAGDPYADEVQESARQIVAAIDGEVDYLHCWQSVGRTNDVWLGPDVETVTAELLDQDYEDIIYIPFGFVADNLETLHDNDIECRAIVEAGGAHYERLPMPNAHPLLIQALADELLN